MSDSEFKDRILYLQDAVRKLSELKEQPLNAIREQYTIRDTILYNMQVVIEALLDIGNYILKRGNHKIPRSRVEVFQLLCNHGYLDSKNEEALTTMAQFRNKLVHGYQGVDDKIVYDILQNRYDFLRMIAFQLVEKSEEFNEL
ncbi:MAG: type VII toxin-antitoxin system HepT family RNase toxin [Candidatus Thorarchaeota archaeon]